MTTRDVVLRALGKKAPKCEMNYELVDQTDIMDIINREREDIELLEHTLKEGRENLAIMGGLKLRQSVETASKCPYPAGSSGFRRELAADSSSSTVSPPKPRIIQAVFLISFLTLIATSLFTLFDSMTVVEIAYKVHALAGIVKHRDERVLRSRGTAPPVLLDDTLDKTTRKHSKEAAAVEEVLKVSVSKDWMPSPVNPVTAIDPEILPRAVEDQGCQENTTTTSARIFGVPTPDNDDVVRLTTGSVHRLHIVALNSFGQRRCAGGDYYETDLRSPVWKSRPPVVDYNNGSYEVELYVDPRFAGKFVFKVTLLFSNLDGLRQLDPMLSSHEYRRFFLDKGVASLEIEFVPPQQSDSHTSIASERSDPQRVEEQMNEDNAVAAGSLDLHTCTGRDFQLRRWSGRWTRGAFNPNCSIDSKDSGRFQCLDPETKCERPWCEGDIDRLESNGWVYSAHCSFKIFSADEAWRCLDGKWLFWWSDSDDQENALVGNLLKSVLGLSQPEGRWDGMGRFSNKVFVRPDGTETARDDRITTASLRARNLKQQVRMTNMWNTNVLSNYDHFQGVISSYFSKFSSPDVVIMNSGLHDGLHWHDWQEFERVGVQKAANCWKETVEAILPTRHPRLIFVTTGAQYLSDFNPQLMEMYTSVVLNAYITANITSDFKIVDAFDNSFSWMGRFKGNQHFVDLMNLHSLLNSICTVD